MPKLCFKIGDNVKHLPTGDKYKIVAYDSLQHEWHLAEFNKQGLPKTIFISTQGLKNDFVRVSHAAQWRRPLLKKKPDDGTLVCNDGNDCIVRTEDGVDFDGQLELELPKPFAAPKKCECGAWATNGANIPKEWHSDWCPVRK